MMCLVNTLIGHTDYVIDIALLNKGIIVSSSFDKTIKFWTFKDGICIKSIDAHNGYVLTLRIIGENTLLSGGGDKSINLWNIKY